MDGFTITLFESADNDALRTQPFMGVWVCVCVCVCSKHNLVKKNKIKCKPIIKLTINVNSKNEMRPTNNSTDKTSCYVTLKHVYLFITALKYNFVPFENEPTMNIVFTS